MATAYTTVNGAPLIEGMLSCPGVGIWHADLVVDAQDQTAFNGAVTFSVNDGALSMSGTAVRAISFADVVKLRVQGGAGGLRSTVLPPKGYQGVPLSIPLGDLLASAGEHLSATADPGVTSRQLRAWVRQQQTAGVALASLLRAVPGVAWRMLLDGSLWLGTTTYAEVDSAFDYDLLNVDAIAGKLEIASDVPSLMPGVTIEGRNVSYVRHHLEPARIRSVAYFE